jgi:hypothetical protein
MTTYIVYAKEKKNSPKSLDVYLAYRYPNGGGSSWTEKVKFASVFSKEEASALAKSVRFFDWSIFVRTASNAEARQIARHKSEVESRRLARSCVS